MLLKKILFPLILLISTLTACVQPPPSQERNIKEPTQVNYPSTPPPSSASQKRLALLIGNSNYAGDNFLTNPVNDAKALAKVLKEQLNFEIIYKTNLNRKAMRNAIRQFKKQLNRNRGVGFFYFSGHGLQYKGKNHLIPIGAQDMKDEIDLDEGTETVSVNYVLNAMKTAANEVNLLILDACRNPPDFVKSGYKGEMMPGMAKQSKLPSGTLIAYAAAPGKKALSGEGQDNSPYVKSLIKWLPTPNLSITDVLTQVRKDVKQATEQQQEPEYAAALDDIFYLNLKIDTEPPPSSPENPFVAGKVFRDRLQDGSLGPKMLMIPGGTFRMGDIQGDGYSNEKPVHSVSVRRFAMGQHEVTVGDFRRFVKDTGYKTDAEKGKGCYVYDDAWGTKKEASWRKPYFSQNDNHPVVCVSWNDVTAYAEWLSEQTDQDYRLPTEAEWEYAARAGTTTKYWWGNKIGANKTNCDNDYCADHFEYTSPVGSFPKNPFGLYDTAGNVWEWTCSEYETPYNDKEKYCSSKHRINHSGLYVQRGGSWFNGDMGVRSTYRDGNQRAERYGVVGVRLARDL